MPFFSPISLRRCLTHGLVGVPLALTAQVDGVQVTAKKPTPDIGVMAPFIFVNQSGYNAEAPQRFTAVNFFDGQEFVIESVSSGQVMYWGNLAGQVGEFSGQVPASSNDYVVRIGDITSDPFRIGPWWLERVSYDGAMQFAIQSRNYVGNVKEPAGFTYAWRDDHHFAFHLRTLVNQFMSNPAAYERMPRVIHYEASLDGKWGALAPYDETAPDIVKLVHWAADNTVTQRLTHEFFKGDLAFFLYAWPWIQQWLNEQNYRAVLDFAMGHWDHRTIDREYPFDESAPDGHDLMTIKTAIGSPKGSYPPGFSIMPNALMAVVLDRESDPRADTFRDAARAQVAWIVDHIDVAAPALTKGQRMNADLLMSSLSAFARVDPGGLPEGFDDFIVRWSDVVIRRSDNLWDFFQLTDSGHWVVYEAGHKTKWNDPGSVLALPSAVLAAANLLPDSDRRDRLIEIAYAAIDHAFGRNPTGRHFSFDAPREIEGVERGWYSYYVGGVGALEDVPFTFDGAPKAPHYPYNPEVGNISWTEGWVSFNTAFSRSLAELAYHESKIALEATDREVTVTLQAPLNFDYEQNEPVPLTVKLASGRDLTIEAVETDPFGRELQGVVEQTSDPVVRASYGFGYFEHTAELAAP